MDSDLRHGIGAVAGWRSGVGWRPAFLAVAVIALAWAALIALAGPAVSEYSHMFEAWEMKSPAVEEAREASGAAIVAAWMIVLFIRDCRTRSSGMTRRALASSW